MNSKFDKLEKSMTSLKKDCKTLKKQNKSLTNKVDEKKINERMKNLNLNPGVKI